jgi:hypothetical protein
VLFLRHVTCHATVRYCGAQLLLHSQPDELQLPLISPVSHQCFNSRLFSSRDKSFKGVISPISEMLILSCLGTFL